MNFCKYKIKILIDSGADVNAKDNDGQTPLQLAIKYKNETIANLIQMHGGK